MAALDFKFIKTEIKKNLAVSMPLIAAQLIYAFSGFLGTAMIAHLGKNELAASVLVNMLWATLSTIFFGIINAVSILVSHQYGAKNDKAICEIMGQAYLLGIVLTLLILLALFSMPLFLRLSHQSPEVLTLASFYMKSLMFTVPGLVMVVITEQFLVGVGRSKLVLQVSFMVVPLEIIMLYLLIFGKLGLPVFGIAGIGYGFAISYTLTAIGLMIYLFRANYYKKYKIFSAINRINWLYIKELIRVGLPMGFMQVVEVGTFAMITFWVAQFGTIILAAHQITLQFLALAITMVFAMSQAVTVRVGHAVGQLDKNNVVNSIITGLLINFFFACFIAIIFCLLPKLLLSLDLNTAAADNQLLVTEAIQLFKVASVLLLFDNFRIIGFGALRGLKDTKFPLYSSLAGFCFIGLSTAYYFAFILKLSGVSIWWGITLGIASSAIMIMFRLRYLLRKIDLVKILELSKK